MPILTHLKVKFFNGKRYQTIIDKLDCGTWLLFVVLTLQLLEKEDTLLSMHTLLCIFIVLLFFFHFIFFQFLVFFLRLSYHFFLIFAKIYEEFFCHKLPFRLPESFDGMGGL